MEVFPGIHRIRVPIPALPSGERPTGVLSSVNVYLLEGDKGWTLIDTGLNIPETYTIMEGELKSIGIDFSDISTVVATHAHLDHIAFMERLKQLSDARLFHHELEASYTTLTGLRAENILQTVGKWLQRNGCTEKDSLAPENLPRGFLKYLSAAFPDAFNFGCRIPAPDVLISNGDVIDTGAFKLEALWTPGHSSGHICLHASEQMVLFSGDHVLPHITPVVILSPYSRPNPLSDFTDSLGRVGKLDVNLTLPGHGDPIVDLKKRIHELLAHHETRFSAILDVIGKTPKTAHTIATELVWMPEQGGVSWQRLDPWSRRLAFMETLAHLKVLEGEGRIERSIIADMNQYGIK